MFGEVVGYLIPGRSFGNRSVLDPVQDVVDDLTMLLTCFCCMAGVFLSILICQINYVDVPLKSENNTFEQNSTFQTFNEQNGWWVPRF